MIHEAKLESFERTIPSYRRWLSTLTVASFILVHVSQQGNQGTADCGDVKNSIQWRPRSAPATNTNAAFHHLFEKTLGLARSTGDNDASGNSCWNDSESGESRKALAGRYAKLRCYKQGLECPLPRDKFDTRSMISDLRDVKVPARGKPQFRLPCRPWS